MTRFRKRAPNAKLWALGHQQLERPLVHLEGLAGFGQRACKPGHIVLRDLTNVLVRQRGKQHHPIDAVPELGREAAFEVAQDIACTCARLISRDRKPSGFVTEGERGCQGSRGRDERSAANPRVAQTPLSSLPEPSGPCSP
jgi:hypothetical protein